MAAKIKKCLICNQAFLGRRDAKTCSPRCRKRLQLVRMELRQRMSLAPAVSGRREKVAAGGVPPAVSLKVPIRRAKKAKGIILSVLVLFLSLLGLLFTTVSSPKQAAAITAANTLNFQARLLTNTGAVVPDGTYNIDFKIYNADGVTGSVGSCVLASNCLWEESYTGANKISIANGYFSVNLNSINNNWNNAVNWDQQYYLTMNIGGTGSPSWDGEMQNSGHSIKLTSVPLAFRANQLGVAGTHEQVLQFASSSFGQDTTISLPDPGASTATVCYRNDTSGCGLTGISGYIQLQGSTPGTAQTGNFNISGGGSGTGIATTFQATNFDAATSNAAMNIGTTNAGAITIGNTTNSTVTIKTKSSTTAFQVQNSGGTAVLAADTVNQNVSVANLSTTGTISLTGQDGGSILLRTAANSGVNAAMTFSGNEITDVTRATGLQGDGAALPDSSTGIWEATTNLITDGGFETNLGGVWTGLNSATVSRTTNISKFGVASAKVVTPGSVVREGIYDNTNGPTISSSTTYTVSAWVWAPSGVAMEMGADRLNGSNTQVGSSSLSFTGTGSWQRESINFTSEATAVKARDFVRTANTSPQATTFYVDGSQLEQKTIATPYVETNGGTASRSAARVQAPATGLNTTQGWVAVRFRPGWSSSSTLPNSNAALFTWGDNSNNRVSVDWVGGTGTFRMRRLNGGTGNQVTSAQSFSAGSVHTIVAYWTSTTVGISVDGANFTTTGDTNIPTLSATTFDIGSAGTIFTNPSDGDTLWLANGSGTLSNADAAAINRLGNSDPSISGINSIDSAAAPAFAWDGESQSYSGTNNSPTLQSGISIDDVNLYHSANGSLTLQGGVNSTSAFQVQTSSGVNLFDVDTLNRRVTIAPAQSTIGALQLLSGASNQYISEQIGRTGSDLELGVAGNNADFGTDVLAGDAVIRSMGTSALIFNNNGGNSALSIVGSKVGIGVRAASAPLEVLATSDQLQLAYDASHYLNIGVKSNGDVSLVQSAGSIYLGNYAATNSARFSNLGVLTINTSSANALLVQNTSNKNIFNVDTSGNQVVLGNAGTGGVNGTLGFATATASSYITTLQGNGSATSNTTITLPTAGATGSQCLTSTSGSTSTNTTLQFGSCGSGPTVTLQNDYDNSSSPATITTSSASKGIVLAAGTGFDNTSLFKVQNAAGGSLLNVDSVNSDVTLLGNNSGDVGAWMSTNATPNICQDSYSVTVYGYVYYVAGTGGCSGNQTYFAKLNADGSTSAWNTSTKTLPINIYATTVTAANGYIYVVGGYSGGVIANVYYTKVNSDGTLSGWVSGTSLPSPRQSAAAVVANGYIYAIGGNNTGFGSGAQSSVYYAKLGADGSVGAWQTGNTLYAARSAGRTVVANGYIYYLGGDSPSSSYQSNVYYAKLNSDGSTGTWNSATNTFATGRNNSAVAVSGGYIYIYGGFNGGNLNDVSYAKLNSDGSTSVWTSSSHSLPTAEWGGGPVVSNGYLYYIGGSGSTTVYYTSLSRVSIGGSLDLVGLGGQNLTDVGGTGGDLTANNGTFIGNLQVQGAINIAQALSVNGNLTAAGTSIALASTDTGELNSWRTSSSPLPVGLGYQGAATANGYIYVVGGYNGSAAIRDVSYAKLNGNGDISTWTTQTNALPAAREYLGTVVSSGYIYAVGGSDGTTTQSTVLYAKLNPDGSTGTWQTSANLIGGGAGSPRAFAGVVTANGYLYVIDGSNGSYQSTFYYAKLNSDGSVGSWSGGTSLPAVPSSSNAAVVVNNYVYVIGGGTNNVYYSQLNPVTGNNGAWTTVSSSFPTGRSLRNNVVSANGYIYAVGGGPSITNETDYTKVNYDGSLAGWSTAAISLPQNTDEQPVVVANGYIYSLGGWNGSSQQAAVYYASTPRVQIGASLDLVGLQGSTLADANGVGQGNVGGSITAGDVNAVGNLQVQGQGLFAQSVSVAGSLNVGSVLYADATNLTITLGPPSSTPVLLVVGNKNTSGDPSGTCTGGAVYYNSNSNQFRFCQNGSWVSLGYGAAVSTTGTSLPSSPADGQQFNLRVGSSPYQTLHLVYDSTYGRWVSDTWTSSTNNISASNASGGFSNVVLLTSDWSAYDTAGLKVQFRFVFSAYNASGCGNNWWAGAQMMSSSSGSGWTGLGGYSTLNRGFSISEPEYTNTNCADAFTGDIADTAWQDFTGTPTTILGWRAVLDTRTSPSNTTSNLNYPTLYWRVVSK